MNAPQVDHPTDRPNFTQVITDGGTFYISYSTVIAAKIDGEWKVSQNEWSTTTGKHLNWIDNGDKSDRVPHSELMAWIASK